VSRPFLIAAGLVVIAIGMSVWNRRDAPALPESPAPAAAPRFDVVHINPEDDTVIAGRAMPRSDVAILDGGVEIGRVIADNRGE
jgi:hypothetical protein